MPGGVAIYKSYNDGRYEMTYNNQTLCTILGYTKEEYAQFVQQDQSPFEAFPQDIEKMVREKLAAYEQDRNVEINLRILKKNREPVWVHFTAVKVLQSEDGAIYH